VQPLAESIAGLPGMRRWVGPRPPLSASGASLGSTSIALHPLGKAIVTASAL
jgi:hypothetical protein